jgi:hypothetical protein
MKTICRLTQVFWLSLVVSISALAQDSAQIVHVFVALADNIKPGYCSRPGNAGQWRGRGAQSLLGISVWREDILLSECRLEITFLGRKAQG